MDPPDPAREVKEIRDETTGAGRTKKTAAAADEVARTTSTRPVTDRRPPPLADVHISLSPPEAAAGPGHHEEAEVEIDRQRARHRHQAGRRSQREEQVVSPVRHMEGMHHQDRDEQDRQRVDDRRDAGVCEEPPCGRTRSTRRWRRPPPRASPTRAGGPGWRGRRPCRRRRAPWQQWRWPMRSRRGRRRRQWPPWPHRDRPIGAGSSPRARRAGWPVAPPRTGSRVRRRGHGAGQPAPRAAPVGNGCDDRARRVTRPEHDRCAALSRPTTVPRASRPHARPRRGPAAVDGDGHGLGRRPLQLAHHHLSGVRRRAPVDQAPAVPGTSGRAPRGSPGVGAGAIDGVTRALLRQEVRGCCGRNAARRAAARAGGADPPGPPTARRTVRPRPRRA